ncbi:hypothetical protein QUF55_05625 [Clostridiaceae bacterium HSG29]|nr:hypothetical protein [Clostridiaceae bacterium HSG29]
MKNSRIYYTIAILSLLITSIGGSIYRNYIYSNNINDCGLADMHTNMGAVIVCSFLLMGYEKYSSEFDNLKGIASATFGFIIYELIQISDLIGTFDVMDIVGSIIGGLITLGIYKIINRKLCD